MPINNVKNIIEIDISGFSRGIYFVKANNGKDIFVEKIILN